ncbi:hypothetical protein J2X45_002887 [Caulobacter sp. BE264]|uniref:hypothetical protein n=1 Tax=Caulobacter sp. BE264 TaxID=2817724 RepID=UPI002867A8F0|nr:hypothetical protein [Caulobacter sp. BE264]MDR7231784.1 hypothetical protein [Caulobacter sp. BE264]
MKSANGLVAVGMILISALIFLRHDLRGWTPSNPGDPRSVVEPIRLTDRRFSVSDCLPGTVSPWNLPQSDELNGDATATVLSCRSREHAILLALAYLAAAALGLALFARSRRGRP